MSKKRKEQLAKEDLAKEDIDDYIIATWKNIFPTQLSLDFRLN